jgi:hypothetical protein
LQVAPAVAVARAGDTAVILGSLVVHPGRASAIAATADSTVFGGDLVVQPTAAAAVTATVDPTVIVPSEGFLLINATDHLLINAAVDRLAL